MFAIYDIDGRRFRNTLENLRKVRETQASPKTLLWSNVAEGETAPVPGTLSGKTGGSIVSSKAVQAYREMRHLNRREPIYHAHQLMSYPVSTVPIEMGILDAQHYFLEQKRQQMPVMNAQQHIVGMLSLKDLLQFIIIDEGQMQYVGGKRVADAMSQEVITADPVSDIRRVAQVMLEYHLDAVPIVDEQDALIGIVSRSDILRAVMNDPPLTMWC
jgi:acetoin utilization protein AcuB